MKTRLDPGALRSCLESLTEEWGRGESLRTLLTLCAVAERHLLPQSVLRVTLRVDQTATMLMVRRLMRQGLVDQVPDPEHRSYKLLKLTPAGVDLLRTAGIEVDTPA